MPADRRVHGRLLEARHAPDERQIAALGGSGLDLRLQVAMRVVVFRDHEQAAGVFVQPVDDAGAQCAADAGKIVGMGQHGIDERAVFRAGRRMDDHAPRLVDHQQIAILIDDRERQGFGFRSRPSAGAGGSAVTVSPARRR